MAFADLGSLGAIGNTNTNQTTLDLVTSAAIAIGDFVVVVVAADNIANGGDDNACSGVTIGIGGQALTKGVQIANALAAQAGASSSIWYGVATGALSSGGTIRATFGSASLVDASAATARKFSVTSGNVVSVEGTPGTLVGNTAADPGSLNVTTANIECLRVRGIASQVGNNTNLTPTSTWTAWANGNSATTGTTGEICARAESLISTATGAASDPTYVSAIYASTYVAFKATLPAITATLGVAEAADTISAAATIVSPTQNAWNLGDTSSGITLSNSDRTATVSVAVSNGTHSTHKHTSGTAGKYYAELRIDSGATNIGVRLGIQEDTASRTSQSAATFQVQPSSGNVSISGVSTGVILGAFANGDTVCAAWDAGAERVWFRKNNGLWNNDASADPATNTNGVDVSAAANTAHCLRFSGSAIGNAATINTDVANFGYTGPSGFTSWMGEALSTNITGTLNVTEADDTISAAGTVAGAAVTGALNVTEANDTVSADGGPAVSGTLSATEANDTLAATGGPVVTGALNVTEANDTVAAAATLAVSGSLNVTEADDTILATGGPVVAGTLSVTEATDTLSATGTVEAVAAITGTPNVTESDDAISAAGTATVSGALGVIEANDTLAALATITIGGALNIAESNDTISSAGTVSDYSVVTGTLNVTESDDTITALATVTGEAVVPPVVSGGGGYYAPLRFARDGHADGAVIVVIIDLVAGHAAGSSNSVGQSIVVGLRCVDGVVAGDATAGGAMRVSDVSLRAGRAHGEINMSEDELLILAEAA